MYPPPPQQPPSIVQHVEPPATLEQLAGQYMDGYNVSFPKESSPASLQEPAEPEKSQSSDMEKAAALGENLQGIAEPIADAQKRKNDAEENSEKINALNGPGYAGYPDPPEQQKAVPKQAETASPSESNNKSGGPTPGEDDGYDYYNGIG